MSSESPSKNVVHWQIAKVTKDNDGNLTIEGYSSKKHNNKWLLLETKIKKVPLDLVLESNEECHEGFTIVIVKASEVYAIDVGLSFVEDPVFVQQLVNRYGPKHSFANLIQSQKDQLDSLMKLSSVDCFQLVNKNILMDKAYLGLPAIVFCTWIGMIVTDL